MSDDDDMPFEIEGEEDQEDLPPMKKEWDPNRKKGSKKLKPEDLVIRQDTRPKEAVEQSGADKGRDISEDADPYGDGPYNVSPFLDYEDEIAEEPDELEEAVIEEAEADPEPVEEEETEAEEKPKPKSKPKTKAKKKTSTKKAKEPEAKKVSAKKKVASKKTAKKKAEEEVKEAAAEQPDNSASPVEDEEEKIPYEAENYEQGENSPFASFDDLEENEAVEVGEAPASTLPAEEVPVKEQEMPDAEEVVEATPDPVESPPPPPPPPPPVAPAAEEKVNEAVSAPSVPPPPPPPAAPSVPPPVSSAAPPPPPPPPPSDFSAKTSEETNQAGGIPPVPPPVLPVGSGPTQIEPEEEQAPALKKRKIEDDTPAPKSKQMAKKAQQQKRNQIKQRRQQESVDKLNIVYLLYFASVIFVVPFLYGVFLCFKDKRYASSWQKTHYEYLIATSWMGALYFFFGFVVSSAISLVGGAMLLGALYWWVMRLTTGVKLLAAREEIKNPETWWF